MLSVFTPRSKDERHWPGYPPNSNRPSASSTFKHSFAPLLDEGCYCGSIRTLRRIFDEQADLWECKYHRLIKTTARSCRLGEAVDFACGARFLTTSKLVALLLADLGLPPQLE
jgi:hypothetical protein